MPKLCPLFSGSEGNCYYIGSSSGGILIDAGRSAKQITNALSEHDIDIKNIGAIFITHEHTDHVKGLKTLAGKNNIKVYSSGGTVSELIKKDMINGRMNVSLIDDDGVECSGMYIKPFNLSHDCREGFGYVVESSDGRRTAFVTDTGVVTDEIKTAVTGCDTVVIESNYDENMLLCGEYPYLLKRRILSEVGHISNDTCAKTVSELVKTGTSRIILAHLSKKNNMPCLAEETTLSLLKTDKMKRNIDYQLNIAKAENNTSLLY